MIINRMCHDLGRVARNCLRLAIMGLGKLYVLLTRRGTLTVYSSHSHIAQPKGNMGDPPTWRRFSV